jgi:predicted ATP-grasp superfamily ATP-dependent carboligase
MSVQRFAIVMNMFYTGLGIARSLGEQRIPVIGLSAHRRVYGNFTRYAKVHFCPDSRNEPERLLAYLLDLGQRIGSGSIIFPTRDDDVVFLDRFRADLQTYFTLAIPDRLAVETCLDKWRTYLCAEQARVPQPQCWLITGDEDLRAAAEAATFPCVLKPVAAHHWRQGRNWETVGGRKAINISTREELRAEYAAVARADKRALLQELVPGGDDCLVIAACYLDRDSNWVAGFNTQKLVQIPEGFGTGCVVQSARIPELLERSERLLQTMRFTGIAEVEYKWDAASREYKLIEINPRPWDQHRLGHSIGVDLIRLAYGELAGLPLAAAQPNPATYKWIAEDTFFMAVLRMLWGRERGIGALFRLARGKRIYAIWSAKDPLPFVAYMLSSFLPGLAGSGLRALRHACRKTTASEEEVFKYDKHVERGKSHG